MNKKYAFLIQTSLIGLLLAACGAPTPVSTPTPTSPPPTQTPDVLIDTSFRYHYVTSKLLIPTTQAQADSFALNIDGDAQNHPDNLFGGLLTLLVSASPGLELQSNIDDAIKTGQIITLHTLSAENPTNATNASWSVFLGQSVQTAPRFDGTDQFTLNPAAPTNTVLSGPITNGHFAGGPGEVHAQMVILGSPVEVSLIGVRLEADVNDKGCTNGKLGGGITVSEFQAKLIPALANGLNRVIAADKTLGNTLLTTFDTDQNGVISADELENNLILKLATSPDLDLLDATGKFNPRQDGVNDSMSVGLGFACAPATFTAPGD